MTSQDATLIRSFIKNAQRLERTLKDAGLAGKYSMTIEEAASYTGLGSEKIRDAIVCGELDASRPLTAGRGRALLVRRTDLESYVQKYSLRVPKRMAA